MVISVDTNIVLDIIQGRQPYCSTASDIFVMCAKKEVTGYIALHSVSNIFFILRKSYSTDERRKILKDILKILTVVSVNHKEVSKALENKEFKDFEDCLQDECAKKVNADYIITRNMQDFQYSKVKAVLPDEFMEIMTKNK